MVMMRKRVRCALIAVWTAATVVVSAQQPPSTPAQPAGPFRTRVTLVPIDVRVVDRNGKPITDLRQSDFTVFEDGVRQEVSQFQAFGFEPQTPAPGARPTPRDPMRSAIAPQTQRVFLLVFGRGRLEAPPANAVDAAIRFVRERLLPQDQIAVLAYNRATDFMTDHEAIAQLLERLKDAHHGIEAKLKSHFTGLAALYARREIPAEVQGDIDRIFGPVRGRVRQVAASTVADANRMENDVRTKADAIMRGDILAGRDVPPTGAEADRTFDLAAADRVDLPFDDYVDKNLQTFQDISNIYTGINYLRLIEGEKHLVFMTESGLFLPRLEDDRSVAALANDARVAIDIVHAGGFAAPAPPTSMGAMGGPGRPMSPLPTATVTFNQGFMVQTSRTIADLTGGHVSAYQTGEAAFSRLDQSTRFEYLLGYYASNPVMDGKFRRIAVKVNRGGAVVQFRHGYYARPQPASFDRRQFMIYSRITAAGTYQGEITDLKIQISPSKPDREVMSVAVTIKPDRVAFRSEGGLHLASLEVTMFCGDNKENVVGQAWQTIDLKLKDEAYQRFMQEGAAYIARVPLTGEPKFVKAILYDYSADLLGSVVAKVP
jgi:VWFA-related protein